MWELLTPVGESLKKPLVRISFGLIGHSTRFTITLESIKSVLYHHYFIWYCNQIYYLGKFCHSLLYFRQTSQSKWVFSQNPIIFYYQISKFLWGYMSLWCHRSQTLNSVGTLFDQCLVKILSKTGTEIDIKQKFILKIWGGVVTTSLC